MTDKEIKEIEDYYNNLLLIGETEFTYGPFIITKNKDGLWVLKKFIEKECPCRPCKDECIFSRIPNFIQVIGESAFSNALFDTNLSDCEKLTCIIIPEGVKIIERRAFDACNRLEFVNLPNTLKEIRDYAFSNCNLKSLHVPNSVTKIGKGAFAQNKFMSSLSLPYGISIDELAFDMCGCMVDKGKADLKIRMNTNQGLHPFRGSIFRGNLT